MKFKIYRRCEGWNHEESQTIEADCWEHAERIAEEWARESVNSLAQEIRNNSKD